MGKEYTPAQKAATAEYMKDKHTFRVVVTKEEEKVIKAHATSRDESVNAFVKRAITETMARDKEKGLE